MKKKNDDNNKDIENLNGEKFNLFQWAFFHDYHNIQIKIPNKKKLI